MDSGRIPLEKAGMTAHARRFGSRAARACDVTSRPFRPEGLRVKQRCVRGAEQRRLLKNVSDAAQAAPPMKGR